MAEIEHASADLRWHRDGAYQFGHDGHRYWACRADNGVTLSHPDLATFRGMIRTDYGMHLVPREDPPDRRPKQQ